MKKSIKTKKAKMGKAHSSLQQVFERELLFLLFMPASSSPPCCNWVKYVAVLRKAALASPPPPPPPLQPLVIPFVQTEDLKCKRAPCWKSQLSSSQLSLPVHSDWTGCAPQWMHWVGVDQDGWQQCWVQQYTVTWADGACVKKKERGGSLEYPSNANDAAEDSSVSEASTARPDLKQRPVIS